MDAKTLALLVRLNQLSVQNATLANNSSNGSMSSSWTGVNSWGTGTLPGTGGRVCSNATAGAIALPSAPPQNGVGYVLSRARLLNTNQATHLLLLDRCVDYSGFSAAAAGAQAAGAQALSRHTTGLNVLPWLEVNGTGASSLACNVSLSYTNELNQSGRIAVAALVAGWLTAPRVYPFILQAGDYGVRSIQSVTVDTVSPNAGDFGVVLGKPISVIATEHAAVTSQGSAAPFRDITKIPSNPLPQTACGYFLFTGSLTTWSAGQVQYSLV